MINGHIVLCHPTDVRNVGSVIRAAANFDLQSVRVVTEDRSHLSDEDLYWFSSGAVEVIQVQWHADLPSAIADCDRVLGTSRRPRDPDAPPEWPVTTLTEHLAEGEHVAVVFGTERSGMTTAEKSRCDALVRIHTSKQFPSMNLSHAVALLAYELGRPKSGQVGAPVTPPEAPRASAKARDGFFDHVTSVCEFTGYPPGRTPDNFVRRFRRLMTRANPDHGELSMVAGVFSEMRRLWGMVYAADGQTHTNGQKVLETTADTDDVEADLEEQISESGKTSGGRADGERHD
ncbi:MAG: RNA methyltransferase [Bradymonadia bacterium]